MLLLKITASIEVSGNDTNRMELLMTALALVDHGLQLPPRIDTSGCSTCGTEPLLLHVQSHITEFLDYVEFPHRLFGIDSVNMDCVPDDRTLEQL